MNASWRGDQRPLREMIEGRVERRLAAILAVDVAGYSRLMGEDEEGTLGALRFAVNQMQTVALICGAVPNAGQAPEEVTPRTGPAKRMRLLDAHVPTE